LKITLFKSEATLKTRLIFALLWGSILKAIQARPQGGHMKTLGLSVLALALVACPSPPPQNFTATLSASSFVASRGGSSSRLLNVCGEGGFRGKVTVTLEGAPAGVSITVPSTLSFDALDCSTALAQPAAVVITNFELSASPTAPLGNNQAFRIVLTSNITKKLDATISISDPTQ
jgi:hypothetical protein